MWMEVINFREGRLKWGGEGGEYHSLLIGTNSASFGYKEPVSRAGAFEKNQKNLIDFVLLSSQENYR